MIEDILQQVREFTDWVLGPGLPVLTAAGTAVALLLPVLGLQRSENRRLRTELESSMTEAARLDEMLLAAPDGFFCWYPDGTERCSRRLAVLLELISGLDAGWDDIRQSFGLTEAAELELAVAALRQDGRGFELELPLRDGMRRVLVIGMRAADADGRVMADTLWMRDVTEGSAEFDRLAGEREELTSELARLQALLDLLPVPVWMRDGDLALIYCNEAYARAVDAPSTELAVEEGAELAAGPALRQARALAARARAAASPRTESFHLVLDGARRLMELTESPLPETIGGDEKLTIGFALDRTREEDLKSELDRHVAAQAEVLEHLSSAIAIFAPDTRLSFYNTAFCTLWGLDDDWLDSQPPYGAVLDQLRERRRLPETADYRGFKEEELKRFTSLIEPVEDLLHLPDERTLRRIISPHPFGGLIVTYEDVTDSLALERSFNTSIAVQRETLDHLHEGVALFGGDGRLRLSNPAFGRIWEIAPDDLAGAPHLTDIIDRHQRFFPASAWPATRERFLRLFTERQPARGRLNRADGTILDYTSVPLPDGAVLMSWLDISDSARVERALRERNDALSAADRLKSEFIANVSCEVRTPLNTIIGFSEILSHEYFGSLNKRQVEYTRGISEAGHSLLSLISDILDLATIEAGQMSLTLDTFDVHAMLTSVLNLTRERVREKNISMNFDCPLDIGWMVADERRIKQVLFNLISNAVKFNRPGGYIILAAQREGDQIVMTVADNGMGIPQAEQARVFSSFTRGSAPEARQQGAGLGLALVKSFVELHAGKIELVSVPNEGTTVTLRLPAGQMEAAAS
ncbi:ATP-binding protein [Telmatospirillum sp. J64-1]|uniref:PAS domain-containing sensor histidine kinase n=1 Tax=Telmatospirillum sp. J64-1 TaxID=2502183 RepID=UPI0021078C68|nr:ATP-binding protein [Telmatospirillum sp. J64-1]